VFQLFVDRKEELKALSEHYRSKKPEFIVIYGRRRVGKTELITHFIKNKPNIYFLGEEKSDKENIKDMQNIMANSLSDYEFKLMEFDSWVELFRSFLKRIKERFVIVIDEFPYLLKQNPALPSEFQKLWDLYLSKSNIVLILIGSSVHMMEKLLGEHSPLYGRRTAQLEIKPLTIFEVREFLPRYKIKDCILVYGCVGGIPLYLKQFVDTLPFFNNLLNIFLKRDAILYSEAEILLRQEFRETAKYFSILKAIAFGNTRYNEIVNYTNLDKTIISKYIQNLERIRVIKREYPITERKEKRKNARYVFSDNYFKFWFRFIYPNKTLIEKGNSKEVLSIIKEEYNSYMGLLFEDIAKEFMWRTYPFHFNRIGRYWYKDNEIDLVALNDYTKQIAFFECKWRDVKQKESIKILKELKEKSSHVKWNLNKRKEYFGLIAKKIENKEKLKKEGYLIFDLENFESI